MAVSEDEVDVGCVVFSVGAVVLAEAGVVAVAAYVVEGGGFRVQSPIDATGRGNEYVVRPRLQYRCACLRLDLATRKHRCF